MEVRQVFQLMDYQSCFLPAACVCAAIPKGVCVERGGACLLGSERTFPLSHPSEKKSESWVLSWRGRLST